MLGSFGILDCYYLLNYYELFIIIYWVKVYFIKFIILDGGSGILKYGFVNLEFYRD